MCFLLEMPFTFTSAINAGNDLHYNRRVFRPRHITRQRAEKTRDDRKAEAIPDPKKAIEDRFQLAWGSTVLLALIQVVKAFTTSPPLEALKTFSYVPLLLACYTIFCVLREANERDRLSGGTFRSLSLAVLASCSVVFFAGLAQAYNTLPVSSTPDVPTLVEVHSKGLLARVQETVAALTLDEEVQTTVVRGRGAHALIRPAMRPNLLDAEIAMMLALGWFGVKGSYCVLAEHGLPKVKAAIRADDGDLRRSFLAAGYGAIALYQMSVGAYAMLHTDLKLFGALRCFMIAAAAHVCQTAAVAGPKRLASPTYRNLNLALAWDAIIQTIVAAFTLRSSCIISWVSLVVQIIAFVCATTGWYIGRYYKEPQQSYSE